VFLSTGQPGWSVLLCFAVSFFSFSFLLFWVRCSHCHNNKPLNTFDTSRAGYLFTTCRQYLARWRKSHVVANDNSWHITQARNTEALDAAEATGPGAIPTPPLPVMLNPLHMGEPKALLWPVCQPLWGSGVGPQCR
ncbi:hypothetical protein B0T25DRAFT_545661, partial [Lasiosphaeria hispida]